MPVQSKKIENAEEEEEDEDETYEPSSQSESETEESHQEEEEEIDNERFIVSDDEEEISSEAKIVKTKKNLAEEAKKQMGKKKDAVKRKASTSSKIDSKKVKKSVEGRKKSEKQKNLGISRKRIVKKKGKEQDAEIDVDLDAEGEEGKKKGEGDKKTPKLVEFNDKNVDYNLYNEAPEHIKQMKVKLSSNILMFSRMIEASSGSTAQGLSYDYAALSFQRNTRTGKAYEFNLPLSLAPTVIKGIQFLIKNNPKFFEKHLPISPKSKENETAE